MEFGKSHTDEQIRLRAYELWTEAGSPEGKESEFWLQSELEMKNGSAQGKRETTVG